MKGINLLQKTLFTLLIAFIMAINLPRALAVHAEGLIDVQVTGDGTCIVNGVGALDTALIPSTCEKIIINDGITEIYGSNYLNRPIYNAKSVVMPETVTSIGNYAFYGFYYLTDISISSNVVSIGAYAFNGCNSLTEFLLPSALKAVGSYAFYNCSKLTHLLIGPGFWFVPDSPGDFFYLKNINKITFTGTDYELGVVAVFTDNIDKYRTISSVSIPCNASSILYQGVDMANFMHTFPGSGQSLFHRNSRFAIYKDYHYKDEGICTVCNARLDKIITRLIEKRVSVIDQISIDFVMDLSNAVIDDKDAKMIFTISNGRGVEVALSDAKVEYNNSTKLNNYILSCKLNPTELNTVIKAQIKLGDGSLRKEYICSVRDYITNILENYMDNPNYAKEAMIIKAMLNYGAYSQIYYNNDYCNLPNEGYELDLSDVTENELNQHQYELTKAPDKSVQYKASNVEANDGMLLELYFKVKGDVNDYTFLLDGEEVTPIEKEGMWCIQIKNIAPKDFGKEYTVEAGGLQLKYSVLSHVYAAITKSQDQNYINLMKSIYLYYNAING